MEWLFFGAWRVVSLLLLHMWCTRTSSLITKWSKHAFEDYFLARVLLADVAWHLWMLGWLAYYWICISSRIGEQIYGCVQFTNLLPCDHRNIKTIGHLQTLQSIPTSCHGKAIGKDSAWILAVWGVGMGVEKNKNLGMQQENQALWLGMGRFGFLGEFAQEYFPYCTGTYRDVPVVLWLWATATQKSKLGECSSIKHLLPSQKRLGESFWHIECILIRFIIGLVLGFIIEMIFLPVGSINRLPFILFFFNSNSTQHLMDNTLSRAR